MLPLTTDLEKIYRVGSHLLDCACNALNMTEAGCPRRRCLVPGEEVEFVNCCDRGGQLTVNVVNVYPSQQFPTPFIGSPINCDIAYEVVSYNVQVLRCSPVGSPERAPDCNALDDAAHRALVDMMAIRTGLSCCLRDEELMDPVAGHGYRWSYGDHLTVGPEGGCTGSQLLVLLGLPTCMECS